MPTSRYIMGALMIAGACGLPVSVKAQAPSDTELTLMPPPVVQPSGDLFARDTYRIHAVVCPFKDKITYKAGDIECGLLQVPENREETQSRMIELHFVKLSATWGKPHFDDDDKDDDDGLAPGKRDDPVIYLTGGPGAQVTYYVKRLKDHPLLKHRDMYILEQRGIGFSGDFCPHYSDRAPETVNVDTFDKSQAGQLQMAKNCARAASMAGVDLRGYNTIENARDVQALRRALGLQQWNVWGISYGSVLGQAYLRQDPQGIRAAVLDAIVPLDARGESKHWRVVKWYDRDLKLLDEACRNNSGCASRYPKLGERVRAAAKSLVGAPIVVEVQDSERFPSGKAYFFENIAAFLPFSFFYEQKNYPLLPGLIYAWADSIERRDETLFQAMAAAGGGFVNISQGMYNAVHCLDGFVDSFVASHRADAEEFPVLSSVMGDVTHSEARSDACRELGIPPRDPKLYTLVQTDIPTLIVEGQMDPITPPPLAKAILPGFSRGTYVEFPYAGHGPTRSVKCAGTMLNKFYDAPEAKPDVSCADTLEAPDFGVLFRSALAPRLLLAFKNDKSTLVAPGIWGAASLLILLVALVALPVAAIGRRLGGQSSALIGGARGLAWGAAALGVTAVAVLGAAIAATVEVGEAMLLFGFVPWAAWGARAGLLAGLLGLAAAVVLVREGLAHKLALGTWVGVSITVVGAVSLSVFLMTWDLSVF